MSLKTKTIIITLITATSIVFLASCAKSSEGETVSVVRKHIMDAEIGKEATCLVMKNTFKITKSTIIHLDPL